MGNKVHAKIASTLLSFLSTLSFVGSFLNSQAVQASQLAQSGQPRAAISDRTLIQSPVVKTRGQIKLCRTKKALSGIKTVSTGSDRIRSGSRIFYSPEHAVELAKLQTSREWQCSLSLFFSMDRNEMLSLRPEMEGRGLASCRNDRGFQTDYAILAELDVEQTGELRALMKQDSTMEFTVSVNSGSFVVTRAISDLQDKFTSRPISSSSGSGLLMLGQHNEVAFDLNLTSRNQPLHELKVKSLNLHFDEAAPEIY